MARRPSIPGVKLIPNSYQQEPISMIPQYKVPPGTYNNSYKNNRIAPSSLSNYNGYSQTNNSFGNSSMTSTKPLIQTSKIYSQNQSGMDINYPNNHLGVYPDNNFEQNSKPISWFSKPLCLGLTRLSGGILFGTMIFLTIASIAGLVVSVVLYVTDMSTNPEWKVLGMVVCSIMLLTVLVTLCIFIYCYKNGRIVNTNNNNEKNLLTSQYNQENDLRKADNYNQSSILYGRNQNITPMSINEDIIQVQDKQTNTETTISPLRPRDFQRGVWPAVNLYRGISYRPLQPRKMVNHFVQAYPNEIDRSISQQRNQGGNIPSKIIIQQPTIHREYIEEQQRPRRFIEPQPQQHQIVEEIIMKPRRRKSEEHLEIIELPDKPIKNQKYNNVSVKRVKPVEEPDVFDNDFNTNHFYK